ncbi:MAG TPA: peptidylprolyl isomerase [bacterium]|nr:peptidylprolyl isomerase [bacterium]
MVIGGACSVKMHYTLKLDDGEVLESSFDGDPIEFEFGSGRIIPGLEKALEGMTDGEEKHVVVACEDAYGPRNPDAVGAVPRGEFPEGEPLEPGMIFSLQRHDGMTMEAMVVEINDDDVTLDLNHPLAGETLHFDVKVEKVSEPKDGCSPGGGCNCSGCS